MKRFICLISLLSLFAASCDKITDVTKKSPKIAIKITSELPAAVYPGETIDFTFDLSYEDGINESYAIADDVEIADSRTAYPAGTKNAQVSFQYKAQDKYAGNTIDFAVCAKGENGAIGHYDIPVYVFAVKPQIVVAIPESAPESFEIDGSALEFDIPVTSANTDIKSITTYKGDTMIPDMSFEVSGPDYKKIIIPFSYTPSLGDVGAPVLFTFEVLDVNGNLFDAYYSVTFTKPASSDLNEFYGITMGLNKCTAYGQFFDTVTNTVYKAPGVGAHCADIDFAIFWSGNATTQGVAFGSPNTSNISSIYPEATVVTTLGGSVDDMPINWKVRSNTTFREVEVSADDFAAISSIAQIKDYYDNGVKPANEHVCFKKAAGSVIAFQIHRPNVDPETGTPVMAGDTPVVEVEKYGIIRITARNASNNTGSIVFDYKIEK